MSKEQVIAWAIHALKSNNIEAEILNEGVRQDDDFWYVPVTETEKNGKRFDYYMALSKLENDFHDEYPAVFLIFIPARAS